MVPHTSSGLTTWQRGDAGTRPTPGHVLEAEGEDAGAVAAEAQQLRPSTSGAATCLPGDGAPDPGRFLVEPVQAAWATPYVFCMRLGRRATRLARDLQLPVTPELGYIPGDVYLFSRQNNSNSFSLIRLEVTAVE